MVACSDCGREFAKRAIGIHMAKAHAQKVVERNCDVCGEKYLPPARGSKFCSLRCSAESRKKRATVTCTVCGCDFDVPVTRQNTAKRCSRECQRKAQTTTCEVQCACAQCGSVFIRKSNKVNGASAVFCGRECRNAFNREHPQSCSHSGGKVTAPCAVCGIPVTKYRSLIERRSGRVFCSRACQSADTSQRMSGQNCNFWTGGFDRTERTDWECNGGTEWKRQCRSRSADTCQCCGAPVGRGGATPHIHHKAGFTAYPALRSSVENGVCLCDACHNGPQGIHSNAGRALREQWEAEALAELGHLLTQPEAQAA